MAETEQPPPSQTLLAAAAGGFGGAVLGVIAATAMMGDGSDSNSQAAVSGQETPVEVVAREVTSE
ncbi:MAG: hypothetical protein QNJ14_10915 [Woeseiaceae bacterium]|nr:hypothetical protein [Woeseiaceae bacterium]